MRRLPRHIDDTRARRHRTLSGLAFVAGTVVMTAAVAQYYAPSPLQPEIEDDWKRLDTPHGTPPRAVMGVVWPALWGLMAASGFRIWQAPESGERDRALALFRLALGMTAGWAKLVFGNRRRTAGLVELLGLIGAAGAYARTASRVDRGAGLLAVPYGAWLAVMAALNAAVVRRNR